MSVQLWIGYSFIFAPKTNQNTRNERIELAAQEMATCIPIPIIGTEVIVKRPDGTQNMAEMTAHHENTKMGSP